jgi:serine/threonine protein kinase
LEKASPKPVSVNSLTHILELVEESEVKDTVRDTISIPDVCGNSIFDIVLPSIKIVSYYDLFKHPNPLEELLVARFSHHLVSLFEKIMPIRTTLEWQQDKQNPLHTLLNVRSHIPKYKCNDAATTILRSLDTLLQPEMEVNAVDRDGLTPLDIAYKHFSRQPSLYTKIIDKLLLHGARQSVQSYKREIRSRCPKSHLKNATDLSKTTGREANVTVVGKYRYFNDKPIGSGAFSSVFLAIKDENPVERSGTIQCSLFALKRIEKAKVNPKEITREVKTLISLSNKCENIVKYYGLEHSEDEFFQYLCVDLLNGDLNEFVTNNDVKVLMKDPAIRVQATKEIINGLEYLHGQMFIHRDLKPGNILYTTDPTLHFKIADFGLTKNMSTLSTMTSATGSGVAMAPGTRCWMAPELISMKSNEHTQQSDIFSLGLVLHYLLTMGKHPFVTGSEEPAHVIERRMVDSQIRLNRDLDPEARSFLQQLLNQDPSKRPPAKYLRQHPFLWSERKKIEFLKAVGEQPEVVQPSKYPTSALEQPLQATTTGKQLSLPNSVPWNRHFPELFEHMRTPNRKKRYRTTKVIDFLRFIRNAYSHREERSSQDQRKLDGNVFLRKYPSLVLDVFNVVQQLGYEQHRSSIRQALETN